LKIREFTMRGTKITKRVVDGVEPTATDRFLWDSDLPGFGLKITPTGARSYVFQYTKGKRKRRVTIGPHGAPWTPDTARNEALQLKGEVARGGDPAETRSGYRKAPTLAEFADRFLKEHAELKKKPLSVREDRRLLDKLIKPKLGSQKLVDITRADITRFHLQHRDTPTQANRALALLSKLMNLAEKWGLRRDGSNPCRHVEKFPEKRRERFLSDAEWKRLGDVLTRAERENDEPIPAIAAIRLLAFTGCRVSEILTLRRDHVDLKSRCLRLPDSKTGAKVVPLSAPACQLLAGLDRIEGNPYVFPGYRKDRPLVGLGHVWERIRENAELKDVRLHDLRHSYASVGAAGGVSLRVIGALLGHRQPSTTHRYAHLSDDPVRAAADRIAGSIDSAMRGRTGKVVSFNTQGGAK
jgi:integrase